MPADLPPMHMPSSPKEADEPYRSPYPKQEKTQPTQGISDPGLPQGRVDAYEAPANEVDPILEKAYPYFGAEGIVLFILGMSTLISPAMVEGTSFFRDTVGGLMMFAGVMKLIRSYKARELPGFLPSLTSAVFLIVVGVLLSVYSKDSFVNERGLIGFYFIVQTVTSFLFANQFQGYPYAGGFKILAALTIGTVFSLAFGVFSDQNTFGSICLGALLMLEGAIVYGVCLGLQRMARGLPYQYDASSATQHHRNYNVR